jgi:glycosyltransferase involved in cell wall biosynthesis
MKILHIISSSGMYGAEAVILNLSRTLNESGHASVLGVFSNSSNPNHQLHEAAVKEGIESHLIPCQGQIDRRAIAVIRELATRTKADVVHAHGYKADIYVYFALRGSGTPFVSTCHNWIDNDLTASLYGRADRLVLRNFASIAAVSGAVKQRLLKAGVRENKIHVVRNGIDLRPFDNASSRERSTLSEHLPTVGLVGRLGHEKGVDIFLRAAALVLKDFPSAKFVVAGDGPDLEKLQLLIGELKLQESVSMLGRRNDMPAVYASLDILVSSSRLEGLPMTILEGMASSLPIVATPVGDVPTVVLDGRTGLLVRTEDIESLAAGIIKLLRDPSLRKNLGTAARKLIEDQFSADRMTDDYLEIYKSAKNSKMPGNKGKKLTSDP